jgi:hypothetical protein
MNCYDLETYLGRYGWEVETPHLDVDPSERTNLIDSDGGVFDEHRNAFEGLRADLVEWMTETGGPLADGCIPLSLDGWLYKKERHQRLT